MAILSGQYIGQDFIAAANAVQGTPTVNAAGQTIKGASQNNPTIVVTNSDLASALAKLNKGPAGTPTVSSTSSSDTELPSYQFIAGWILLFVFLTFANKTRIGHVVIYYSLILIILLILVTEYQQIVPILNSIQTIGMFNTKKAV